MKTTCYTDSLGEALVIIGKLLNLNMPMLHDEDIDLAAERGKKFVNGYVGKAEVSRLQSQWKIVFTWVA